MQVKVLETLRAAIDTAVFDSNAIEDKVYDLLEQIDDELFGLNYIPSASLDTLSNEIDVLVEEYVEIDEDEEEDELDEIQ